MVRNLRTVYFGTRKDYVNDKNKKNALATLSTSEVKGKGSSDPVTGPVWPREWVEV